MRDEVHGLEQAELHAVEDNVGISGTPRPAIGTTQASFHPGAVFIVFETICTKSRRNMNGNNGQGQAAIFTPPDVQEDGRVAKQDEYRARIATSQAYWEYPHRQDLLRALGLTIADGAITEVNVVAQLRRHNKESVSSEEPDLTLLSVDHAARYSVASWRIMQMSPSSSVASRFSIPLSRMCSRRN